MFAKIVAIIEQLLSLVRELRPTAFEKKEKQKKDVEGQRFWDDRPL